MSKPGGPTNAWSSTTLKTQCKNQKSILESGIPLQKAFKANEVQCIFHLNSFQNQSVNIVSSVNKYKISLELAKHISGRVVKL